MDRNNLYNNNQEDALEQAARQQAEFLAQQEQLREESQQVQAVQQVQPEQQAQPEQQPAPQANWEQVQPEQRTPFQVPVRDSLAAPRMDAQQEPETPPYSAPQQPRQTAHIQDPVHLCARPADRHAAAAPCHLLISVQQNPNT